MSKSNQTTDSKNYLTTLLLAFFLGGLGIDRFYLEQNWTGILKLITGGGLGLWYLYDLFITVFGNRLDKHGISLVGKDRYKTLGIVLFVISALSALLPAIILPLQFLNQSSGGQSFFTPTVGYNQFNQSTYLPYDIKIIKNAETDLITAENELQANNISQFEASCSKLSKDYTLISNAPTLLDATKNNALFAVKDSAGWETDCSAAPNFKYSSIQRVISDFTSYIKDIKGSLNILE